ncbi:MAG: tetratricopeptide repeat protein [Candidatus Hydrogenedens sp.]|nr:tetratricopeptide repeat protein [Candidatus Hydrogenedens sp.]
MTHGFQRVPEADAPKRRNYRSRVIPRGCLLCALALFAGGCATGGGGYAAPTGANPRQNPQARTSNSAVKHEIAAAQRYIEEGRYSQVLPRLLNVASRYPDNPEAAAAHYYIGVAYARIGGYPDALKAFDTYLAAAPEGPYAAAAREEKAALESTLDASYMTPEQLDAMTEDAAAKLAQNEGDIAQQLLLADLLWKQGKYPESGKLYEGLVRRQPQLMQDTIVQQRIEPQSDGSFVVLTPDELLHRAAEKEPLMIYGAQSYESAELRGDLRYYEKDYYTVSGNVVNQSEHVVQGAQVLVTIYGFGSKIFDTKSFALGTMRPGDHRAFSVRFDQFDNVDNIQRFECQTTFSE